MTTQTKYGNYDSESDYYAMGYRMYSAEFGRFLTVDPLFEAMPRHNPYHYAFNSPLVWKDPSGLAPVKDKNIHSEKLQGQLIKLRNLSNPIMPGDEYWVYIRDDRDFYFSAEYGGDFADAPVWDMPSLGGNGGGGGVSSGRSLRSTLGFGPRTKGDKSLGQVNGGKVKAGTRTNPIQNYTKINVHHIEKNMGHLNFDNYPYPEDNPIDDLSTINNYLSYLWGMMDTPTFGVGSIGYLTKKNTIRFYTNAIIKGTRPFTGNGSTFAITFAKIGKYAGFGSMAIGSFSELYLYSIDRLTFERMVTDIGMMIISNSLGGWYGLLLGLGYEMTMYEFQDSRILFDSFGTNNMKSSFPIDKTKVRIIKRSNK